MAQRPRQPETVNSDLHRRKGPTLVVLPSYGRDGLDDFDNFTGRIADAGWRVVRSSAATARSTHADEAVRPQPRAIAGSAEPIQRVHALKADRTKRLSRY